MRHVIKKPFKMRNTVLAVLLAAVLLILPLAGSASADLDLTCSLKLTSAEYARRLTPRLSLTYTALPQLWRRTAWMTTSSPAG